MEQVKNGKAAAKVQKAELEELGLWVVGQVMLPPRYYPATVDRQTGERRPDQYAVTVFYGAQDLATFYVPIDEGKDLKPGDVVRIGPCRAGRNGRLYLMER